MTAVKLTDVARRAGVSLATASRVVNGSDRKPAEDIAERVREAADALGYIPNAQAQALARSATGLLGLVVHDIADPYFSTITRGAQRFSRNSHSQVLLASTDRDEQAEVDAVAAFASYRTDAIILAGSRGQHSDEALNRELRRYTANGGRVVTLGKAAVPGARVVEIGNRQGARALTAALIERGITRFAILSGPPQLVTTQDRVAGYREALAAADLAPQVVVEGGFNREGGYQSALACWEQLDGLDDVCVLAANDVMALGALSAFRSLGLRVPEDVQLAGFDDIPTLLDHAPLLTTFWLPLELIGERVAELALSPDVAGPVQIQGEVRLRESTR